MDDSSEPGLELVGRLLGSGGVRGGDVESVFVEGGGEFEGDVDDMTGSDEGERESKRRTEYRKYDVQLGSSPTRCIKAPHVSDNPIG